MYCSCISSIHFNFPNKGIGKRLESKRVKEILIGKSSFYSFFLYTYIYVHIFLFSIHVLFIFLFFTDLFFFFFIALHINSTLKNIYLHHIPITLQLYGHIQRL